MLIQKWETPDEDLCFMLFMAEPGDELFVTEHDEFDVVWFLAVPADDDDIRPVRLDGKSYRMVEHLAASKSEAAAVNRAMLGLEPDPEGGYRGLFDTLKEELAAHRRAAGQN